MKNAEHLSVCPIFHWTDRRIKVHIFTCVLVKESTYVNFFVVSDKKCCPPS